MKKKSGNKKEVAEKSAPNLSHMPNKAPKGKKMMVENDPRNAKKVKDNSKGYRK